MLSSRLARGKQVREPWPPVFRHRLIMAYALLVPLVVVPTPLGKSIGAADLLLPLALVALAAGSRRDVAPWRVFLVLFLAGAMVVTALRLVSSDAASTDASEAILVVRVVVNYIPLALVLDWQHLTHQKVGQYVGAFLLSGSLAVFIGVVLHHLGVQVRDAQQQIWFEGRPGVVLRAGGLLGNSSDFGHLAAALGTAAITLGVLVVGRPWLMWLVFVLALYATFLSASRASLVHLLVAAAIMGFARSGGSSRSPRRAIAVVGLAVAGYLTLVTPSRELEATLVRLDVLNLTGGSTFFESDTRSQSWSQILRLISSHPLLGIGYGRTVSVVGDAGDNAFLSVAVELGVLVGSAFLLLWMGLAVRALFGRLSYPRLVAIAVVFSELVHMLTVDTYRMWATMPVVALLIGLSLASRPVVYAPRGSDEGGIAGSCEGIAARPRSHLGNSRYRMTS